MCPEIITMKGSYQKDIKTAPGHKQKLSKSKKRTILQAKIGERRVRARAWSSRRPQRSPDRVERATTGNQSFVPSVAMAPRNTTQYLMDIEYAERLDVSMEECGVSRDFSTQSHTPFNESHFSSSDSDYDRSLDFQQRDFEELFFRNEI